ncbi:gluconate 2-dehydrogenase subunit 3 family protein [Alteromonas aestuariivivens]|uniref:Gluconate 2-dehydrogenase subunit 3 family protein n=1 Tax=Alteromonas aestuariivivens TaxID=1938339 RepID=A0A3D8M8A4_9ALTE|nr:gluconate 2-dehydrogenase subunit 3 family protein [Alteromonas aestuariivivens]RDV25431.1 gluconate 2-dehydrogenase subunit 3 family protein [Alteromonas aestuariivivens]
MSEFQISRRVFIGTMAYLVTAPVLSTVMNPATRLFHVARDGKFFTAWQLTVLNDVAEIMIPRTDTPGASDVHVASLLDELMMTWAGEETKRQFPACLESIDSQAMDTLASPYISLPLEQRQSLIQQLDKAAFREADSVLFASYRALKEMIFHVYYSSKEANPDFVLVPGGFKGCVTEDELKAIHKRGRL